MRLTSVISFSIVLAAMTGSAHAISLGDVLKAGAENNSTVSSVLPAETSGLLKALTGQLGITQEQAIGGSGALLGLAKNKLSNAEVSQLTESVPGLESLADNKLLGQLDSLNTMLKGSGTGSSEGDVSSRLGSLLGKKTATDTAASSGGALGNLNSMSDVNAVFSKLGMDGETSGQFVDVIMGYLKNQDVSSSLLSRLGSIWGA